MALISGPYLTDPTETFALSSSGPTYGAPGIAGELRFFKHPTYGMQIYRLHLNESAAALVVGKHYATKGPDNSSISAQPTISGLGAAATLKAESAGVAVSTAADDYWAWMLVYGTTSIIAGGTEITKSDGLEFDASGVFLDNTAGSGTRCGQALATIGNGASGLAFINLL